MTKGTPLEPLSEMMAKAEANGTSQTNKPGQEDFSSCPGSFLQTDKFPVLSGFLAMQGFSAVSFYAKGNTEL